MLGQVGFSIKLDKKEYIDMKILKWNTEFNIVGRTSSDNLYLGWLLEAWKKTIAYM